MNITTELLWSMIRNEMKEHSIDFSTASLKLQKTFCDGFSNRKEQDRIISVMTMLRHANDCAKDEDAINCYNAICMSKEKLRE